MNPFVWSKAIRKRKLAISRAFIRFRVWRQQGDFFAPFFGFCTTFYWYLTFKVYLEPLKNTILTKKCSTSFFFVCYGTSKFFWRCPAFDQAKKNKKNKVNKILGSPNILVVRIPWMSYCLGNFLNKFVNFIQMCSACNDDEYHKLQVSGIVP